MIEESLLCALKPRLSGGFCGRRICLSRCIIDACRGQCGLQIMVDCAECARIGIVDLRLGGRQWVLQHIVFDPVKA